MNFTHGEHVTFGAIVAWWINVGLGVHLIPAAVIAIGRLAPARWSTSGSGAPAPRGWPHGDDDRVDRLSLRRGASSSPLRWSVQAVRQYRQDGIDIGPITCTAEDIWIIVLIIAV